MRFSLYIAWRYLFAKKTHNAINIITLISMIGIAVGAMALVVILSVTNGLERLIMQQFNAFHADIEISPATGKTFSVDSFPLAEFDELPFIRHRSLVLEETGMITYREAQHLVSLRGVDPLYPKVTGIDTLIIQGVYAPEEEERNRFVLGNGVARVLNASIHDFLNPIEVFVPRRGRTTGLHPAQAFRSSANYASGIFAVQTEFDMEYVILPLRLMRELLQYENEVSSIMASLNHGVSHDRVQRQLQELLGPDYVVRNRLQQQDFLYKIMRSEKWAIFFILTFILVIAAFNIIGSLTMLVLEKRRDIAVLRSMGASRKMVERIFLLEGLLVSVGGALLGVLLGALISWLQMRFGLITIQAQGMYIIDAYPVFLKAGDILLVSFTVFCIGYLATLVPLHNMWKTMDKAPV
ncbi:MAG: FtsX-like permease family protein [Bacteroidales bacterium]|nr:FtsX-like permease family protein [Bacteroidales bacterium]